MRLSALPLGLLLVAAAMPVASVHARPPGAVAFTFDDGCASAMDAAAMLEAHGWRGTFYVLAGRPPPDVCQDQLTPGQIAELAARGHDVESHTVDHPHLPDLAPDALREEMRASQVILSTLAGRKVQHLAYPYGEAGPQVEAAAAQTYQTGRLFYSRIDAMPLRPSDPYQLPAIGILANTTVEEAMAYVERAVEADATLLFGLHDLRADPEPYDTTPALFGAILDAVAARGVRVATLAEAMGGASGVRFAPGAGGTGEVRVALSGAEAPDVARVESREGDGPWVALAKTPAGDWRGDHPVEPGRLVEHRATLRDGRVASTCAYVHPTARCAGAPESLTPPFPG